MDRQKSGGLVLLAALPLMHCVTLSRAFPLWASVSPSHMCCPLASSTITTGMTHITLCRTQQYDGAIKKRH